MGGKVSRSGLAEVQRDKPLEVRALFHGLE
jgi:hypothetical protein